jgi:hypothetical protein
MKTVEEILAEIDRQLTANQKRFDSKQEHPCDFDQGVTLAGLRQFITGEIEHRKWHTKWYNSLKH